MKAVVVIREVGGLRPDYSLDFEFQELPRPGDYLSINRPDTPEPYSEDLIVRKVWWRLHHPETAAVTTAANAKVGKVTEVMIECDVAIGPHSTDKWRDIHAAALSEGKIEEFEIARLSIRQDEIGK